jgi:hypothetical protein
MATGPTGGLAAQAWGGGEAGGSLVRAGAAPRAEYPAPPRPTRLPGTAALRRWLGHGGPPKPAGLVLVPPTPGPCPCCIPVQPTGRAGSGRSVPFWAGPFRSVPFPAGPGQDQPWLAAPAQARPIRPPGPGSVWCGPSSDRARPAAWALGRRAGGGPPGGDAGARRPSAGPACAPNWARAGSRVRRTRARAGPLRPRPPAGVAPFTGEGGGGCHVPPPLLPTPAFAVARGRARRVLAPLFPWHGGAAGHAP